MKTPEKAADLHEVFLNLLLGSKDPISKIAKKYGIDLPADFQTDQGVEVNIGIDSNVANKNTDNVAESITQQQEPHAVQTSSFSVSLNETHNEAFQRPMLNKYMQVDICQKETIDSQTTATPVITSKHYYIKSRLTIIINRIFCFYRCKE